MLVGCLHKIQYLSWFQVFYTPKNDYLVKIPSDICRNQTGEGLFTARFAYFSYLFHEISIFGKSDCQGIISHGNQSHNIAFVIIIGIGRIFFKTSYYQFFNHKNTTFNNLYTVSLMNEQATNKKKISNGCPS